ncbi:glutaminase [Microbacterium sp.]|mgnify:FL=1|uniref:glutaminase n=1 Tax=Microbacterium sp. TaxID=51671 RepID=UPI000927FBB2|nr:glutaminase [Microbacterium sp.]OJU57865.1 MAG: glutaminase [Microbacterium sp. 70-38]
MSDPSVTVGAVLAHARARLADIPRERLGEASAGRRILGIARSPRIVPVGEAWHLGVLLLAADPAAGLLATGDILRARAEVRRGFAAQSQRERAERAAAARRGGFAEGEVVHVGWRTIDLAAVARGEASDPLAVVDGEPRVRWSRAGGYVPLAGYLDERIALLRHPPAGATGGP